MNDSWRRRKAEEKIAEWSVERGSFVAALQKIVSEKRLAGEWTFEKNEDVENAIRFAQKFFDEYSHKIVPLSDGRCVYFVPDERAKARWNDISFCWAEYAFHSVSSGGARIPGKNYNFRKYNEYKVVNTDLIESTLLAERCVPVLKNNRVMDSLKFFGNAHLGGIFDVVVRLDDFGNANANLTEVTFEASSKRKQKNMPQLVSLTEAIRTVVSHQTATGTYPPNENNISNPMTMCKGAGAECSGITVIILIGQEKIHLRRCIEKLAPLKPRQIFLVESQPDDGGVVIAKETAAKLGLGLETVYHKWPGNQAAQFNWALDFVEGQSKSKVEVEQRTGWILRLDADEYLTDELIDEIKVRLPQVNDADGVVLKRRHVVGWLDDAWVKRGMYPTRILRLFRRGKGRSDMKLMDEHIVVDGKVVEFDHDFVDHSLISFEEWKAKHRGYAKREAMSQLSGEKSTGKQAAKKAAYYKLPRYFRAVIYWSVRFFLKGAILEGPKAWRWCWWHALWYRWIVDSEIGRLRRSRKS